MSATKIELPDPYAIPPQPQWNGQPVRTISDADFECYQRRLKVDDLRHEAQMPAASVDWWKKRSKVLGRVSLLHEEPSGNVHWDSAWRETLIMLAKRGGERSHGIILGLIGKYGTGKTLVATGLMLLVTRDLITARYSTLFGFNLALEEALRPDSTRSRREVLEDYQKPRLLVLDDCSAGSESEPCMRLLRELIDCRYQSKRDTILISNVSAPAFKTALGNALVDRMAHGGGYIEFTWASFRQ